MQRRLTRLIVKGNYLAICVLLAIALIGLGGCSAAHRAGRPHRSLNRNEVIKKLEGENARTLDKIVDDYYAANVTDAKKQEYRNELIDRSIVLIDLHYSNFIDDFSSGKKTLDSAAEIASMATATASVLFTPALTKSILAAVSGGITATKSSIDKNFLYDQTIQVLIKQMEAQRTTAVVRLIDGQQKPLQAYSLAAALADIERYYFAGTFDGALAGIQQNSAKEKEAADANLAELQAEIEASLETQVARGAEIAALVTDQAKRDAVLNSLEFTYSTLDADRQIIFVGLVHAAFSNQIDRQPDIAELKAINENDAYWVDPANAMKYLRGPADSVAIGHTAASVEDKFDVKIQ